MLDRKKTDPVLGEEIHKILLQQGVETPMVGNAVSDENAFKGIEEHVRAIMEILHLDLSDDSLSETPKRVAKMYLNEVFWGLDYKNFPKVLTIENKMGYSNMLIERNIKVQAHCEHHLLPFIGEAFVAYIPSSRVIGLSKLNRVVEFFCRRPQVQERLTEQIFHTLCHILDTDNVAVVVKAVHTCVKVRGVEDTNSDTITSKLGGNFMDGFQLRNEFFNILQL